MNNEKPKDYDVYFKDKDTVLAVANYYAKLFNNKHKNYQVEVIDGATYKGYEYNKRGEEIDHSQSCNDNKIHWTLQNLEPDRVKLFIRKNNSIAGYAAEDEKYLDEPTDDIYNTLDKADEIDSQELDQDQSDVKEKYRPIFFSPNAITLSDKIQIVVRFYGEPEEVHKSFDFLQCTGYWTSSDNKIYITKEIYEAVMNKTLIYNGSQYPICSLFRIRKFINRGWKINAGQILKIALQISQLDLNNIDILSEQCVGVDSAYFTIIIDALHKKQESDPNWKLDNSYIISIIDKVFR